MRKSLSTIGSIVGILVGLITILGFFGVQGIEVQDRQSFTYGALFIAMGIAMGLVSLISPNKLDTPIGFLLAAAVILIVGIYAIALGVDIIWR